MSLYDLYAFSEDINIDRVSPEEILRIRIIIYSFFIREKIETFVSCTGIYLYIYCLCMYHMYVSYTKGYGGIGPLSVTNSSSIHNKITNVISCLPFCSPNSP